MMLISLILHTAAPHLITQKDKVSGTVAEQLKLRKVDGQLELRDLDENTLFDIVEGGVQDGVQPDRDGTPG